MKKCSVCDLEKEESEFFKKRINSLEGFCKKCKVEKLKKRMSKDPEKFREKERIRSERRRETDEYKEWRKDYQKRNRRGIREKSLEDYYEKNRLEKQKIWKANNKEKLRAYTANSRKKFPLKTAARSFLCAAIKEGIVIRPDTCIRCSKECKPEAHHEDYLKPLEVVWLCRSCHGKEHRKHKD